MATGKALSSKQPPGVRCRRWRTCAPRGRSARSAWASTTGKCVPACWATSTSTASLLAGRFTLLEQDALDTLLPQCLERNVSVIIGGPYNSGLLATAERRRATYDYQPVDDARWDRAQHIRRVCESHGVDPRAAALQYPLRHPAVASVIPGVWSMEEVRTNLALAAAALPESLWDDLAQAGLARRIP